MEPNPAAARRPRQSQAPLIKALGALHHKAWNFTPMLSHVRPKRKNTSRKSQVPHSIQRARHWICPSPNETVRVSSGVAERKGFEPLIQLSPYGALAKRCLQPLGHLSGAGLMTRIWRQGQTGRYVTSNLVRSGHAGTTVLAVEGTSKIGVLPILHARKRREVDPRRSMTDRTSPTLLFSQ